MFSRYLQRYKEYNMNKTEQETPFSKKSIKFRPHIVYIDIFVLSTVPDDC